MMLSWNCPPVAPLKATRLIVAHHAGADLHHAFAHHRVDLARHDRAARLPIGQLDFVKSAARAAAEPANVVGDVEQRDGDRAQLAVAFDQAVALGVGFEMVDRLDERRCRFPWPAPRHTRRPNSGCVLMPGADRGAAGRQFEHRLDRTFGPLDRQLHLPGKAAELLAQPQRRGVGQVRAADLDDLVPCLGLFGQHVAQPLERRESARVDRRRRRRRESPSGTCRWCSAPCSRGRWDGSACPV